MYFCERHEKLLSILKERGSVSVEKLTGLLYVSQPTVRRDLAYLDSQNLIHRTFGGASLRKTAVDEIPFELRDSEDLKIKNIIAKKNCFGSLSPLYLQALSVQASNNNGTST